MFEKLEETYDLVPAVVEKTDVVVVDALEDDGLDEVQKAKEDQDLARDTYRRMLGKSEELLESLSQIAAGTEHPRAFEVASNLIKTIVDIANRLDESAGKTLGARKAKGDQQAAQSNVQNNLFMGSSEDLMKLIKSNSK